MGQVKSQLWKEPDFDESLLYPVNEPEQENEMKLNEMIPSTGKYLKKEDVEPAILATIASFSQEDVSAQNEQPDIKAILHFSNVEKPLVLNQTNGQLLSVATGLSMDADTSEYLNRQIVLFNDKTVSFGGKLTGGIRIRAAQNQPVPAPPPIATPQQYAQATQSSAAPTQAEPFNDDVPF